MEAMPGQPSPDEPVSELRPIPIRESGEPLVDFCELYPSLFWVVRHPVFAYQRFRLARRSVADMLAEAAGHLPRGLRLAVVEGWRALPIQRAMYEATRSRLRAENPHWSPQRLGRTANRFSAPPDRRAPPPHTTGAAVDVSLVRPDGTHLDFIAPYAILDPRGAAADAVGLTAEAEDNRAILRRAMSAAGFTNYPAEWWHWSFGDQAWAYRGGHPEARYGAVTPPGLEDADFEFAVHPDPGF
jgi:D-alanyl-D-alanine dipeptidase